MTHLCQHCGKPFRKPAHKWDHVRALHPKAQAKLDAEARLASLKYSDRYFGQATLHLDSLLR